ncbi:hypothetical protein [Neisseria sp. HMSC061H08]|nr:hypothetical protein [Neisseria sp. HMSC061H08]
MTFPFWVDADCPAGQASFRFVITHVTMSFPVTVNGVIKMRLSEFEVLQLAATLAAPYADRYSSDYEYVERMFHIAEAIKRKLKAQQPKGKFEVS